MNSPLQTDLYQLTMAAAYWQAGKADQESAFQLFFRGLPFKGGSEHLTSCECKGG